MRPRPRRGFTTIELMVTLTVFVTLMLIAVPYMGGFLQSQRIKNASMDIASTVAFARSEALKRNATVNVTASGSNWSKGWSVVTGSTTIRSYGALQNVSISAGGSATSFSFSGDGRMQSTALTFQVQPTESNTRQQPLCVTVGTTGRVQSTKGACS